MGNNNQICFKEQQSHKTKSTKSHCSESSTGTSDKKKKTVSFSKSLK